MNLDLNSLQAVRAGKDYSTDLENYLVQSLANLGQRLGVKGDSIKTGTFLFKDIFDDAKNSKAYNSITHIGVIERRYGVMYISIVPRSTLSVGKGINAIEHQVFSYGNTLIFDNSKEIHLSTGKIDAFKKNTVISTLKAGKYIICGIGQRKNKNSEYVDSEFLYEEFDRDTDNLICGLRIFSPEDSNTVLAITFTVTSAGTADAEVFNLGNDSNLLKDILDKLSVSINSLNSFSINENTKGASNESRINSMSIEYWIKYLKLNRFGNNYDSINNIQYEYGTEITQNIFNNSSETIKNKISRICTKYNTDIKTDFQMFQYTKAEILDDLKEYFSDSLYASSKTSFREQILCAMFNGIYPYFPSNAKIYIPLDYIFNYYCNSNDSWKIYGGIQDINVRFVNTTITPNNLSAYYADDQWIANISGDNQSALFNYSVQYSEDNPDLVYAVNVEKKYTLPYINSDNVWVINNQITNIPASGKDAGNPNIIIVYNKLPDGNEGVAFNIISGIDKNKIVSNNVTWKKESALIQPIEQINLEDPVVVTKSDLYKIVCRVPYLEGDNEKIKQDLLTKLEYALIINISSVNCFDRIDETVRNRYGENGVVTTLWKYDPDSSKFKLITNPAFDNIIDNVALDIVYLTNLNNLVKWHIVNHEPKHPDRYTHSWVVFDNAKLETKNSENDFRTYVYPVLQNKTAEQYYSSLYKNDYNFVLKYVDTVEGAANQNIQTVSNSSSKYLTSDKIAVLNNLYNPGDKFSYNEYSPDQDLPLLDLGEVLTKDQNLLNRSNIISLDNNGNMFYSYIGSSFNEMNKNRVHIGSSYTNINFGTDTMISNSNRSLFKRPNELHLDFENNFINGFAYVSKDLEVKNDVRTRHINWTIQDTDVSIYSTMFVPSSRVMMQYKYGESYENYMTIIQFNNKTRVDFPDRIRDEVTFGAIKRYYNNINSFVDKYSNINDYKLWIPLLYFNDNIKLLKRKSLIYLQDGLYIPALLCRLGLKTWAKNLQNVKITSNMKMITYSTRPLILLTNNRFLNTVDFKSNEKDASVSFTLGDNFIYTGNPLEIAYYIKDTVLYITINESSCNQTINNLFKIQLDY